jgi:hypothetical protein
MGLNKGFQDVITDLDQYSMQVKKTLESKFVDESGLTQKQWGRKIRTQCRTTLFDILSMMVDFCKAILNERYDVLKQFYNTDDQVDYIITRSDEVSRFISREDELMVSFFTEGMYNERTKLYDLIVGDPDLFKSKDAVITFFDENDDVQVPKSKIQKYARYISTIAEEYDSNLNPFGFSFKLPKPDQKKLDTKSAKDDKSLSKLSEGLKKLTTKEKPKSSKSYYPKLAIDGGVPNNPKKRKTAPDAVLDRVVSSIKKPRLKKRKISDAEESNSECDASDFDNELLGSVHEYCENEYEFNIQSNVDRMPKLQERLLLNYKDTFDDAQIIEK